MAVDQKKLGALKDSEAFMRWLARTRALQPAIFGAFVEQYAGKADAADFEKALVALLPNAVPPVDDDADASSPERNAASARRRQGFATGSPEDLELRRLMGIDPVRATRPHINPETGAFVLPSLTPTEMREQIEIDRNRRLRGER